MKDFLLALLKYFLYTVVLIIISIYIIKARPALLSDETSEKLNKYVDRILAFFNISRLPFLEEKIEIPSAKIKKERILEEKPEKKFFVPNRILDFLFYNNFWTKNNNTSSLVIKKINSEIKIYQNQLEMMASFPLVKAAILSKKFGEESIAMLEHINKLKNILPHISDIIIFDEKLNPLKNVPIEILRQEDKVLLTKEGITILHPFFDSNGKLIGGISILLNLECVKKSLQPLLKNQNFILTDLAYNIIYPPDYEFPEISTAIKNNVNKIGAYQLRYFKSEFFNLVSVTKYPFIIVILNLGRLLIFISLIAIILFLFIEFIKAKASKEHFDMKTVTKKILNVVESTHTDLKTSMALTEEIKQIPEIIKSTVKSVPIQPAEPKYYDEEKPIIKVPEKPKKTWKIQK